MHPSPLLPTFGIALALMLVNVAINVFPTLRSSARVRTKGLLRAAIVNALIIVCAVVHSVRHH